jgi:hypothetical protein
VIKEPDKVPVYHADEAAAARVHVLLSICANTLNYPKLKPLHDEAMAELELLAEEGRVRLLKWQELNRARDAEIARLKAEEATKLRHEEEAKLAAQQRSQGESQARPWEDGRSVTTNAARRAQIEAGRDPRVGDRSISPQTEADIAAARAARLQPNPTAPVPTLPDRRTE